MRKRIFDPYPKKNIQINGKISNEDVVDMNEQTPTKSIANSEDNVSKQKVVFEPKYKKSYREDTKTDKYDLDNEWVRQSDIFMDWTESYAYAVEERNKLKDQLALVRAELGEKVRLNPEKYGILKLTESAIESFIVQQSEYKEASLKLIKAETNVIILGGVRHSLGQKKSALENLVRLYHDNYYAKPDVSKQSQEIANDMIDERLEKELNDE